MLSRQRRVSMLTPLRGESMAPISLTVVVLIYLSVHRHRKPSLHLCFRSTAAAQSTSVPNSLDWVDSHSGDWFTLSATGFSNPPR